MGWEPNRRVKNEHMNEKQFTYRVRPRTMWRSVWSKTDYDSTSLLIFLQGLQPTEALSLMKLYRSCRLLMGLPGAPTDLGPCFPKFCWVQTLICLKPCQMHHPGWYTNALMPSWHGAPKGGSWNTGRRLWLHELWTHFFVDQTWLYVCFYYHYYHYCLNALPLRPILNFLGWWIWHPMASHEHPWVDWIRIILRLGIFHFRFLFLPWQLLRDIHTIFLYILRRSQKYSVWYNMYIWSVDLYTVHVIQIQTCISRIYLYISQHKNTYYMFTSKIRCIR